MRPCGSGVHVLSPEDQLDALIERLGRPFADPSLLARALCHRSWCAESPGQTSNERLEFLGDSVLGLVVTDHLYRTYPDLPEGHLAQVRAAVVNAGVLAEAAVELDVGVAIRLGKGEDASGGREKPSILSDAMEAVIGAVYLDGGWYAAAALVMEMLEQRMAEAAAGPGGHDYKTRLQELAARQFDAVPRYDVVSEGPDHAKRFTAHVSVGGELSGVGQGRSKKQAEQAAAQLAWRRLSAPSPNDDRHDPQSAGADMERPRAGVGRAGPGDAGADA